MEAVHEGIVRSCASADPPDLETVVSWWREAVGDKFFPHAVGPARYAGSQGGLGLGGGFGSRVEMRLCFDLYEALARVALLKGWNFLVDIHRKILDAAREELHGMYAAREKREAALQAEITTHILQAHQSSQATSASRLSSTTALLHTALQQNEDLSTALSAATAELRRLNLHESTLEVARSRAQIDRLQAERDAAVESLARWNARRAELERAVEEAARVRDRLEGQVETLLGENESLVTATGKMAQLLLNSSMQ
ncbi:hypothetical protein BDK51DRAFT_45462 [Blyttiomyces helicus]|uniref:Uncharacterized protein n=1 Tax=Blyttiomyces helicus TaxID=388810 RepID=A0A4P9W375_9FUNG|nr:hypothetical protein BDK51DRAFT_45462 [Blyttiomyces helicus]|eukprot:RKO86741.1 hypothetical protein BDK51DRAFT_45462 [Blyttiomyces helicus]